MRPRLATFRLTSEREFDTSDTRAVSNKMLVNTQNISLSCRISLEIACWGSCGSQKTISLSADHRSRDGPRPPQASKIHNGTRGESESTHING